MVVIEAEAARRGRSQARRPASGRPRAPPAPGAITEPWTMAPPSRSHVEHLVRVGPVPPTPGRLAFHIPMRPSPHRFDRSQIRPPTRRALQAGYDHLSRQLQLTLLRGPAARLANTIIVVQSIRPREPRRFCELAPGPLPAPFCDIAVVDLTFSFPPSIFDNSTDIDNFSYNSQQLSKIIICGRTPT